MSIKAGTGHIADILGQQDMIERGYSSCDELDLALRRFVAMGLVVRERERFLPTRLLLDWQHNTKARELRDQITYIQVQLNAEAVKRHIADITLPEHILDEETYRQALAQYRRSWRFTGVTIIGLLLVVLGILTVAEVLYPPFILWLIAGILLLWLMTRLRR